ncbi:amino acid ABC transporter permease [Planktotalea sp.]|uniref:amino acid ABC transporter permease n=1 Tax=Planktotalea sp. TaxID=2029877 RepID=UPI003F6CB07F
MTNTNTTPVAFVRDAMLVQKTPPVTNAGIVGWINKNLFPNPFASIGNAFSCLLTLVSLLIIYKIVAGALPWFANGVWDTPSLAACREVLQGVTGGCFSVLTERWNQLLFGFKYPSEEYWRPTLAFIGLFFAAAPVLFSKLPRKMLWFTAVYPFLAFWLIWGGTILVPVMVAVGFIVGYFVFAHFEKQSFAMGLIGSVVAAVVVWSFAGYITDPLSGVLALEPVPSRDMGGFMLNFILGVVCVSLSIPIGILLALGRQSDMPIIKGICVVFIEFIRGVPLITLLFVANVVLAYFLPPGTTFDLILRVIIMITMFSAAYIAEVIRGGLAALPNGQYEAGGSLGLDYAQNMRLIILPQALKISIPGIVNVAVGLFKDTTLVSVISMFDLVGMIRGPILASTEWNGVYWELFGSAVVLFFIVCYGISQYSQWLERQLATGHR